VWLLYVSAPVCAEIIELAPATMAEMSRAPMSALETPERRERHRPDRPLTMALPSTLGVIPEATSGIAPPKIGAAFRAASSSSFYPADAAGAVSARHVVAALNSGITVQDRAGKQLSFVTLGQFWTDPSLPSGGVYDPRIVYDAVNDRWILTTLYDVNLQNGAMLLAVSESGDPSASWRRYRVPVDAAGKRNADLPRVGQTSDAVILSADEWSGDSFLAGSVIFTIPKSYGTAAPAVVVQHFTSLFDVAPVSSSTATRQVVYAEGPYMVVDELTPTGLRDPKAYTTSVAFTHGFEPLLGPQLGSSKLMDAGDTMPQNAVSRGGALWAVHAVKVTSSRTAILVWKISGGTAKTYLIEDPEAVLAFPSIAVNRFGAALIGYAIYTGSTYPSAAYSYIDPAGNLSASATMKSGESAYFFDRWGDYTTTLVDPVDDTSFWSLQLYPLQPNTWAAWWSQVPVPAIGRGRAARH